jgi:hypothetical protein
MYNGMLHFASWTVLKNVTSAQEVKVKDCYVTSEKLQSMSCDVTLLCKCNLLAVYSKNILIIRHAECILTITQNAYYHAECLLAITQNAYYPSPRMHISRHAECVLSITQIHITSKFHPVDNNKY